MEKEEEEKVEKSEAQKKLLVDKAQSTIGEPIYVGKKGETVSGKFWKMALPHLNFDAELVLCRCCSKEAGAKRRSGSAGNHHRVGCGGRHFREQKEKHQREWKRSKGVDRTDMRNEEKRLRCALLNGTQSTSNPTFVWGFCPSKAIL